jgi:hypothetical protein
MQIYRRQPVGMEVDHLGDLAEALTSPELYPMDGNIIENLLASIDQRSWDVRGYVYTIRHHIPNQTILYMFQRPAYFAYTAHRRHSVYLITA